MELQTFLWILGGMMTVFVACQGVFLGIMRDFHIRLNDLNDRQSSHREHHVSEAEFEAFKEYVMKAIKKNSTRL